MRRKHLTPDDECRVLHEAYQFLFRKYNLGEVLECTNEAAFENGEVPPSPGKYGGKRTFPKEPFKYYVSKRMDGVKKWQFLLIYSSIYADVCRWA